MSVHNKKLYSHYRDIDWLRESFFQFTPKALYGADFRPWYNMGGWNELYIPYSFVKVTDMIANVSVSLMELIIHGEKVRGVQFATVGTLPEYQNQGLSRELMQLVLEEYAQQTDLFFLFANDTVLDFYPKFGFTRVQETIFSATVAHIRPNWKARKLDVHNSIDLQLIKELATNRVPVSEVLGADNYWHILLFYLPHYPVIYLEQEQLIVIAIVEGGVMHVYDIISDKAFSFKTILPFILQQPVHTLYFYFTPDKIDLPAVSSHLYTDSPLFVKGHFPLQNVPVKFPLLAQT